MVLLVVDMQKSIVNEKLFKYYEVIGNIKELIKTARANNIEVIFAQHDDGPGCELHKGNTGYEIKESVSPLKDEKIFDKNSNSCFRNTGLLEYLREQKETDIIIVGLQTEYCIDATVQSGFEHHFQMIVPAYANTTVDNQYMSGEESYHYYNEFMWDGRYAKCISMDEILELMASYK